MKYQQILTILFFSTTIYAAADEPDVFVMSLPHLLNKAKTLPRVGVLYNSVMVASPGTNGAFLI